MRFPHIAPLSRGNIIVDLNVFEAGAVVGGERNGEILHVYVGSIPCHDDARVV